MVGMATVKNPRTQAKRKQPRKTAPNARPARMKTTSERIRSRESPSRRTASTAHSPRPASTPEAQPQKEAAPQPQRQISQAEAIKEVVRRANAGSEACLAHLPHILDKNPNIWKRVGDVGALAEKAWIDLIASGDKLVELSVPRRLQEVKAELAGPAATPLEKLLIDMVGVRWLAAQHAEYLAAQVGGSLEQARFRCTRAESAVKRFTSAVKTLTLVRTLMPARSDKPTPTATAGQPREPERVPENTATGSPNPRRRRRAGSAGKKS